MSHSVKVQKLVIVFVGPAAVTWTRVVAENECISAFKGYNRHSDNHSAQVVLCKRGGCAVQTVRHWLLNCVTTEVGLV